MKRPGPLTRKTPLRRLTPLKRKPSPQPHPELAKLSRELRAAWKAGTSSTCAACGAIAGEVHIEGEIAVVVRIEGHHVVRQQLIKAATHGMGGEHILRALWDLRNKLDVCERCHGRHHRRLPALKWSLIEAKAPAAIAFAEQVDLLWRAKLDYELED